MNKGIFHSIGQLHIRYLVAKLMLERKYKTNKQITKKKQKKTRKIKNKKFEYLVMLLTTETLSFPVPADKKG